MVFQHGSLQAFLHRGRLRFLVLFQDSITDGDAVTTDVHMPGLVGGVGDECGYLILCLIAE